MDFIVLPLLITIQLALRLYMWVLVAAVILNWLILFRVINPHQSFVRMFAGVCFQLTDPLLERIRRYVPFIGGFDLAPLILFFAIYFLQNFVERVALYFL